MTRARRHATRIVTIAAAAGLALGVSAAPAVACGGLVAPNGAVRLLRTTTLAAYHDGVEHYVTSFQFAGNDPAASADASGPSQFGSIVPLPGIPTTVERGGDWTLQRLEREVAPKPPSSGLFGATATKSSADTAEVLLQTRIDALDITVLRGGGTAVADWARDNGFLLTPDAPEVLDFYAERSPIFLAARFDATAARAQRLQIGDGTPIHLTIPVDNPWVPQRILALGRGALEPVNADIFLLTDSRPALLAGGSDGITLERSQAASSSLLTNLRTDKGMGWVPDQMWLSFLKVDTPAGQLTHDLAIDASGADRPSVRLAGLERASVGTPLPVHRRPWHVSSGWVLAIAAMAAVGALVALEGFSGPRRPPVERW
jgi:hypothetical protein